MRLFAPLLLSFAVVALAGCGGRKVYPLADVEYDPNPNVGSVRLFVGDLETPHQEIAFVDSHVAKERTGAARSAQLQNLRERAAKLGADAVVDIKVMKERHRGMVPDPATPYRTWEQGEFELYFLRGKAIRFTSTSDDPVLEWEEVQAGMELEARPSGPALIPTGGEGRIPEAPAPREAEATPPQQPRPGY